MPIEVVLEAAKNGIHLFVDDGKLSYKAPKGAMSSELRELISNNKHEIIEFLSKNEQKVQSIKKVQRGEHTQFALSYSQQRLWLLDQIDEGSAHYNMVGRLRLSGQLNHHALRQALMSLVERHETLRTCFIAGEDGQAYQHIQAADAFTISEHDLSQEEAGSRQLKIAELACEEASRVFDLSRDFMLRAELIRLAEADHLLFITLHHIASDGWSMSIFINEFCQLYSAYVEGQTNPLPPLAVQYVDYAHWQRQWLQGEVLEAQFHYWETQLANLPIVHSLPLDKPRPQEQTFAGATYHTQLERTRFEQLSTVCQSEGATLFMGLQAALAIVLSRYSHERDIVMGTPIANREQAEIASLIGFFVNNLVLRNDLSGNPSFKQVLAQSKAMLLDAYAHQQVPFEQIVERLQPERSLSHTPLFQIMIVLHNNEEGHVNLPGLTLSSVDDLSQESVAQYDLTLDIEEREHGLAFSWEYNTDLFSESTIAGLAGHFETLLSAMVNRPEQPVFDIELLSEEERHQILDDWNQTTVDYGEEGYGADTCIHELIEAYAASHPNQLAVVFEDQSLSYAQLNAQANQLAHYLINERGIQPDDLVGLCVERSPAMVIGLLGILKAGGAYVPLDPSYPQARLQYMIDDAQLQTIVTHCELSEVTGSSSNQNLCLDDSATQAALAKQPINNIDKHTLGLHATHLAYVIYTSGSTGQPKGTMIAHRGLCNLAFALRDAYRLTVDDSILQFAPMSFDMSVEEIFGALCNGTRLVLRSDEWIESVSQFWSHCEKHQLSIVNLPTAFWHELAKDTSPIPACLRQVCVGGDKVSDSAVQAWFQKTGHRPQLINAYGPTEYTVNASLSEMALARSQSIGKPLNNTQLYVLNESGMMAPVGVVGELCIGGVGLARGYLNRPELTASRFIKNPYYDSQKPHSSDTIYRTGDLVRWSSEGEIEFLGRVDHQVKVRGFRIELGEIESALSALPLVNDTLVLAKESGSGDSALVAYVVLDSEKRDSGEQGELQEPELVERLGLRQSAEVRTEAQLQLQASVIEELREGLSQSLPVYMQPSALVLLEHFPLTPNGKVDRKALPSVDKSLMQRRYEAPRTETERALCEIWQEVLGIEQVGVNDNFFELGGHSLLAMRLISRINTSFGVNLPLKVLFESQKLEELSKKISTQEENRIPALVPVSSKEIKQLSYGQQQLWLLDKIEGDNSHFNMPGSLNLTGILDYSALNKAFSTILDRHESLRTHFISGEDGQPYQSIQKKYKFNIDFHDLSGMSQEERSVKSTELINHEVNRAFDLSKDLMLRVQLIKKADSDHNLLVVMHHIASDGWSMSVLVNEFCSLYKAYLKGDVNPLNPINLQYADYANWQRTWLQGKVLDDKLAYWEKQLSGLPVVHSLPLDFSRPKVQTYSGTTLHQNIDVPLSQRFKELCRSHDATLFMGLHTVFSALLSRYSNQEDIVIGTPIANREQPEIENLIGFFVNNLVLRSDLSGDPSFIDLLNQSKEVLLGAYEHQQVPFDQVVERLQPERQLSHGPLYQVMLILQNNEEGILDLPDLQVSSADAQYEVSVAKHDLTLEVSESDGGLQLGWEYNTDLFKRSTIERMSKHFENLIGNVINENHTPINGLELVDRSEKYKLIETFNQTTNTTLFDKPWTLLFEEQVAKTPNDIAIQCENRSLTYEQLETKSGQLAKALKLKGVTADDLVGLVDIRDIDLLVMIIAVLRAGAAYLPLDPNHPPQRWITILEDAKPKYVIIGDSLVEAHDYICDKWEACKVNYLSSVENKISDIELTHPKLNHLAYVIYTSGSTGRPKGVMIEHRGMINNIRSKEAPLGFSNREVIAQSASQCFDISVWQFLTAPILGAKVVILKDNVSQNPLHLVEALAFYSVTIWEPVPAMLLAVSEELKKSSQNIASLRWVLPTGDALTKNVVRRWFNVQPQTPLMNAYGPAECSDDVAFKPIYSSTEQVLIGRPVANVQLYIVNKHLSLQPVGVIGELAVAGPMVGRGYINLKEKTAEVFKKNPFAKTDLDSRLYRTGDLARWLPDGNIEYLGRLDHQVKIRGYRIELGEIESVLTAHPDIKEALVLAKSFEDAEGHNQRLVAYLIPETAQHDELGLQYDSLHNTELSSTELNASQVAARQRFLEHLQHTLGQQLPDYMLPTAYQFLPRFPLSPNGKIDRKQLPEPDTTHRQADYVSPRNETEQHLSTLWQALLGVERIGVHDNFFALGGHSLLATRLVNDINQHFHVNLPLKSLFEFQTLEQLGQVIDSQQDNKGDIPVRPSIVPIVREGPLVTSYSQQRLWLLDQIDEGSAHYNMVGRLRLSGQLNHHALRQALMSLVERHETLRTCFIAGEDGQAYQHIQAADAFTISEHDLSQEEAGSRQLKIAELACEEASRVFDLSRDFMLRAELIRLAEADHLLFITLHHIASDGWSMSIFINEFCQLYSAYVEGQTNPLPPLAVQYVDYAHWQRQWLQGEVLEAQFHYWETQLANLPIVHSLPLDKPRPQEQTFAGATYHTQLERTRFEQLSTVCQSEGATLFMGLQAALAIVLSRYSHERDIVMGTPIANREQAEIASLIGFFVNNLVLRNDLSGNPSFKQVLTQSKAMLLDAYAHQQVPFEQIVERLQPERSLSHTPLFQIMIVLHNNEEGHVNLPGLTLSSVDDLSQESVAQYDLTLDIEEREHGLAFSWEYNTDLFSESTIAGLAGHFETLLSAMVNRPEQPVFDIELLSEEERHQILDDWNQTTVDYGEEGYGADTCIHELIEAYAASHPNQLAVVFEDQSLSYAQLNAQANQLAHYLINERGIQPDDLVGLCVERSPAMVIGLLGILKAGGAYVPLDPSYPQARLQYMIDDAQLQTIVTHCELSEVTGSSSNQNLCLDDSATQAALAKQPINNIDKHTLGLHATHLAYVIYTSGSTGQPKGTMIAHRGLCNLAFALRDAYRLTVDDSILQFAPMSFDMSVEEIFGALCNGTRLVLRSDEWIESVSQFWSHCEKHQLSIVNLPTAFWHELAKDTSPIPACLRQVCVGGDKVSDSAVQAWFLKTGHRPQLINAYGPTEYTVNASLSEMALARSQSIGKPLNNTQLYVLNESGMMAPVGVVGELCIGGVGLARGYLNRPELTASRFIKNPYYDSQKPHSSDTIYRTGDLVRWSSEGEIEFLGRVDHQVKVRGFRIELGEIESALSALPLVNDTLVLAKESESGDSALVAYVVLDSEKRDSGEQGESQEPELVERLGLRQSAEARTEAQLQLQASVIEELREGLSQSLPVYMQPSALVLLEHFPLTPNGKVDRKALPSVDKSLMQRRYEAPRTETERALCEIWQEVLGIEQVGVNDNFFELGGHSLLAMKFLSIVKNKLEVSLSIKNVFSVTSLSELAVLTDQAKSLAKNSSLDDLTKFEEEVEW